MPKFDIKNTDERFLISFKFESSNYIFTGLKLLMGLILSIFIITNLYKYKVSFFNQIGVWSCYL
jgi:hypothetical protein